MPRGPASDPMSSSRFSGKLQLSPCVSAQGLGRACSCKAAGRKGCCAEPEGCLHQLCHFGKNSFSKNLSFLNLHQELLTIALLITRSCYYRGKRVKNHKASPYCSGSVLYLNCHPIRSVPYLLQLNRQRSSCLHHCWLHSSQIP